jgi:protease-4
MNKRQIIIVICIILAPVMVGLIITAMRGSSGDALSVSMKKIGLVRIDDIIYQSDAYVKQLEELRKDNAFAGVLLRINSPGGTVAPSQEIYREVLRFREEKKPVVVSMDNIAASGGYYIASAGTKIFANPGTLTGSIGVFVRFPYWQKLFDKIGVEMITIKAGEFKDMGNPNRPMTDPEKKLLQQVVDDTHLQFMEDIARGRGIPLDSIKKIADGRIFTGRQAQKIGLVDTLGGYEEAADYLKSICGLPEKAKIVEKNEKSWLKSLLLDNLAAPFTRITREISGKTGAFYLFEL